MVRIQISFLISKEFRYHWYLKCKQFNKRPVFHMRAYFLAGISRVKRVIQISFNWNNQFSELNKFFVNRIGNAFSEAQLAPSFFFVPCVSLGHSISSSRHLLCPRRLSSFSQCESTENPEFLQFFLLKIMYDNRLVRLLFIHRHFNPISRLNIVKRKFIIHPSSVHSTTLPIPSYYKSFKIIAPKVVCCHK